MIKMINNIIKDFQEMTNSLFPFNVETGTPYVEWDTKNTEISATITLEPGRTPFDEVQIRIEFSKTNEPIINVFYTKNNGDSWWTEFDDMSTLEIWISDSYDKWLRKIKALIAADAI